MGCDRLRRLHKGFSEGLHPELGTGSGHLAAGDLGRAAVCVCVCVCVCLEELPLKKRKQKKILHIQIVLKRNTS